MMLPLCAVAQKKGFKMAESSSKEKPKWVMEMNSKGYIVVQAIEAVSVKEAQETVKTQLLAEIASSVAITVADETVSTIDWTTEKDKDDYKEDIKRQTVTKVKGLPAFQGISLAKADVYWERFYNKKTGGEYYNYYISYPFTSFDLEDLIEAYNAQEKAINDKIQKYKDNLDEVSDVETIDRSIAELRTLNKSLDPQDARRNTIESVINMYNRIYDNVTVEVISKSKGIVVFQLMYGEKMMTTKQTPRVSSNCANNINVKNKGDKVEVKYNCDYCYSQDDNYIEVKYKMGNKFVKKQIIF